MLYLLWDTLEYWTHVQWYFKVTTRVMLSLISSISSTLSYGTPAWPIEHWVVQACGQQLIALASPSCCIFCTLKLCVDNFIITVSYIANVMHYESNALCTYCIFSRKTKVYAAPIICLTNWANACSKAMQIIREVKYTWANAV